MLTRPGILRQKHSTLVSDVVFSFRSYLPLLAYNFSKRQIIFLILCPLVIY